MSIAEHFTAAANAVAHAAGKPMTFGICCFAVILWGVSGPLFHFSDTWQLVINTSTTIVTFLMVFLIQNTQNRDGAAVQAKLDELIRSSAAQNYFIGIEHLTEEELDDIRQRCEADAEADLDDFSAEVVEKAKKKAASGHRRSNSADRPAAR